MNEIVAVVFQWHQGTGIKAISRSLGFDRKTVRKYIQLAQAAGVTRSSPFLEETSLVSKFKEMTSSSLLRETPAQDVLFTHREWMGEVIKAEHITAKQVWRLLKERADIEVSYATVKRHIEGALSVWRASGLCSIGGLARHPGAGGFRLCRLDDGFSDREESACMGLHHDSFLLPAGYPHLDRLPREGL